MSSEADGSGLTGASNLKCSAAAVPPGTPPPAKPPEDADDSTPSGLDSADQHINKGPRVVELTNLDLTAELERFDPVARPLAIQHDGETYHIACKCMLKMICICYKKRNKTSFNKLKYSAPEFKKLSSN